MENIMQKYRKKPVIIEACTAKEVLFFAGNNFDKLPDCVKVSYEKWDIIFTPDSIIIKTLEGHMTANLNDYIIKGIKGELYPCKPDIFEQTYEKVEE